MRKLDCGSSRLGRVSNVVVSREVDKDGVSMIRRGGCNEGPELVLVPSSFWQPTYLGLLK